MGPVEGPVKDLVMAVLDAEGCAGGVVVAFVGEHAMVELNGRYRGQEGPTDVLAFQEADSVEWGGPLADASGPAASASARGDDLGEVVVCPAVVYRYAGEDNMDARTQMGWTLIHSVLHLVGYDHEVDDGEMRLREQGLMRELAYLVEALPMPRRVDDGS